MRLVIATCTVDYVGRLTAYLPSATRLLLVKADGSVSVHADDRAYKPSDPRRRDDIRARLSGAAPFRSGSTSVNHISAFSPHSCRTSATPGS